MKYILLHLLCAGGCVLSIFGIGPGLASMSLQRSSSRVRCLFGVVEMFLCMYVGFIWRWVFDAVCA